MIYCLAALVPLSACASCHHQLGKQQDKEGCAWPWRLTPAAPRHCQAEVVTRAPRLVAGKEHLDPGPGCSALPKPICVPAQDGTLLCTAPEGIPPPKGSRWILKPSLAERRWHLQPLWYRLTPGQPRQTRKRSALCPQISAAPTWQAGPGSHLLGSRVHGL